MTRPRRILTIVGTRPEAIKLAPVVLELQKRPEVEQRLIATAQHREILDQALSIFGIEPDIDLDLMEQDQVLSELTSKVLLRLSEVYQNEQPDVVVVQGDTTTVMAAALAAFYRKISVAHVEAGLRSYDKYSPFPEEVNRRVVGAVATYNFAPTERAKENLLREGIPASSVWVTGNTVVDALLYILKRPEPPRAQELLADAARAGVERLILLTAHRRENFGQGIREICEGVASLVARNPDVGVVYPVHPNSNVRIPVHARLGGIERVFLVEPVPYDVLVHLMARSYLVLTDSGGIQEEAPALGKPVLVLRRETERPEGVEAGTARVVGPFEASIVEETERLLHDAAAYETMARAVSPYGDGKAAARIADVLVGTAERGYKPPMDEEIPPAARDSRTA